MKNLPPDSAEALCSCWTHSEKHFPLIHWSGCPWLDTSLKMLKQMGTLPISHCIQSKTKNKAFSGQIHKLKLSCLLHLSLHRFYDNFQVFFSACINLSLLKSRTGNMESNSSPSRDNNTLKCHYKPVSYLVSRSRNCKNISIYQLLWINAKM